MEIPERGNARAGIVGGGGGENGQTFHNGEGEHLPATTTFHSISMSGGAETVTFSGGELRQGETYSCIPILDSQLWRMGNTVEELYLSPMPSLLLCGESSAIVFGDMTFQPFPDRVDRK